MFFKNRHFQVKVVQDKEISGTPINREDPVDKILIAQSYADLAVGTATDLAKVVVTVIVIKTACDLLKITANAITK